MDKSGQEGGQTSALECIPSSEVASEWEYSATAVVGLIINIKENKIFIIIIGVDGREWSLPRLVWQVRLFHYLHSPIYHPPPSRHLIIGSQFCCFVATSLGFGAIRCPQIMDFIFIWTASFAPTCLLFSLCRYAARRCRHERTDANRFPPRCCSLSVFVLIHKKGKVVKSGKHIETELMWRSLGDKVTH